MTAKQFQQYHEKNPQIYYWFKIFTLKAIYKGHKALSAEFIFNVIRWETDVTAINDKYKINNDAKPYYARLFMKDYPQYDGFFRTRERHNEFKLYHNDNAAA